jgi:YrhK-like protein
MSQHNQQDQSKELIIKLGHREVTIRRQYKAASIINDFLIALWFTLGSIFFSIIRRRWPPYGCSLSAVRNFLFVRPSGSTTGCLCDRLPKAHGNVRTRHSAGCL